jgi:hypothetical protein
MVEPWENDQGVSCLCCCSYKQMVSPTPPACEGAKVSPPPDIPRAADAADHLLECNSAGPLCMRTAPLSYCPPRPAAQLISEAVMQLKTETPLHSSCIEAVLLQQLSAWVAQLYSCLLDLLSKRCADARLLGLACAPCC